MGNILLIGVGLFTVGMIVLGMKRGMVKMAFSLVSVVVILILVNILSPSFKQILKHTPIYTGINTGIESYVDDHVNAVTTDITTSGVNSQKKIIEELPLPKSIQKSLVNNNNQQSYAQMKAKSFSAYIATSLTDMVMSALSFVMLFIIIFVLIRVLMHILNLVTKLPVIKTFNSAGGALIGLGEAVVILWIACIIITLISTTPVGQQLCKAISGNSMLSFIYDNNLIQKAITGLFTI